jgi:hypothetical protein
MPYRPLSSEHNQASTSVFSKGNDLSLGETDRNLRVQPGVRQTFRKFDKTLPRTTLFFLGLSPSMTVDSPKYTDSEIAC